MPAHKNQSRSTRFLNAYGITFRQYRKLLIQQKRRCLICQVKTKVHLLDEDAKLDLCVDHCHATGKIRGLLCGRCNTGLGMFKDNPDLLKAAIAYLETTGQPDYCVFPPGQEPKRARKMRAKTLKAQEVK